MRNSSFNTASYRFINYAEMTNQDSEKIFNLRNNPLVAFWMVNNDYISLSDHLKFIEHLKSNSDKDYFIVKDINNDIVGSVNLDYSDMGVSERGVYVDPDLHGKGHAFRMLSEFYAHAKSFWKVCVIKTKVKQDNRASNALEIKLGAMFIGQSDGYNNYILNL